MDDDKRFLKNITLSGLKNIETPKKDLSHIFNSPQISLLTSYSAVNNVPHPELVETYFKNYDELTKWHSNIDYEKVKKETHEYINSHTEKHTLKKINSKKQNINHSKKLEEIFKGHFILDGKNKFIYGKEISKDTSFSKTYLINNKYSSPCLDYGLGGMYNPERDKSIICVNSIKFQAAFLDYLTNNEIRLPNFKQKAVELYQNISKKKYIESMILFTSFHENTHREFSKNPVKTAPFIDFDGNIGNLYLNVLKLNDQLNETLTDYLALKKIKNKNPENFDDILTSLKIINNLDINENFEKTNPFEDVNHNFMILPHLSSESYKNIKDEISNVWNMFTSKNYSKLIKNYKINRKEELLQKSKFLS